MMINCPSCQHQVYTSEVSAKETDLYDSNESEHLVECDSCKKEFVICADWEVTFKAIRKEQSELYDGD